MPNRKNRFIDLLFRRHGKELLAFAGQRSSADLAEDLVQEAYLRLLQHGDWEAIDNPRAYLYRVTSNLSSDLFRRDQVRGRYSDESDEEIEAVVCPQSRPEDSVDAELRLMRCLAALETLPEVYRHVFLLHRIDGLTHAEIGEALRIPRRTVERYCAKALAHCLAQLDHEVG